jgi:hypothetical protein
VSQVLRKLERLAPWTKVPDWVSKPNISADVLTSSGFSQENSLSFFKVTDEQSVRRTAAALAANRGIIKKFEYVLIDEKILKSVGFEFVEELGETADSMVNEWHLNLEKLTGCRLVELYSALYYSGETDALTKPEVEELVRDGLSNGRLDKTRVCQELISRLAR